MLEPLPNIIKAEIKEKLANKESWRSISAHYNISKPRIASIARELREENGDLRYNFFDYVDEIGLDCETRSADFFTQISVLQKEVSRLDDQISNLYALTKMILGRLEQ